MSGAVAVRAMNLFEAKVLTAHANEPWGCHSYVVLTDAKSLPQTQA